MRVRKRNWKDKQYFNKEIAKKLREVFKLLGIDIKNDNFKDTDRRLTQLLEDFTYANSKEGKEELKYLFTRKFKSEYSGMVISKDIICYSLCPHHFSNVKYRINFSYIPDKYVLGLSKVIDIIKILCLYPKLQEDLTDEIANCFMKELKPKGLMITIEGNHSCMQIRDSEARETSTITSAVRGVFKHQDTRNEFLRLIGNGR